MHLRGGRFGQQSRFPSKRSTRAPRTQKGRARQRPRGPFNPRSLATGPQAHRTCPTQDLLQTVISTPKAKVEKVKKRQNIPNTDKVRQGSRTRYRHPRVASLLLEEPACAAQRQLLGRSMAHLCLFGMLSKKDRCFGTPEQETLCTLTLQIVQNPKRRQRPLKACEPLTYVVTPTAPTLVLDSLKWLLRTAKTLSCPTATTRPAQPRLLNTTPRRKWRKT